MLQQEYFKFGQNSNFTEEEEESSSIP